MNKRIKKVIALFRKHKIGALLVSCESNVSYLCGFPSSESWLLITPKKAFYITDFRYVLEAKKALKGISLKEHHGSVYATVFEILKSLRIKRLGFEEEQLTLFEYKKLQKQCSKGRKAVATRQIVEDIREIKESSEINKIRHALKIHHLAYRYLKRIVKPGLTEKEVLLKLEFFVKSRGVGFSFDPIVAAGPNSCLPHAQVTNRRIKSNDVVLIDMGIDYKGYKSDLTRMFFFGRIPKLIQETNDIVFQAQQSAIAGIKAGQSIAEIDNLARNYLAKKKLAKFFGHSLGHGVGLDIHESPRVSGTKFVDIKRGYDYYNRARCLPSE